LSCIGIVVDSWLLLLLLLLLLGVKLWNVVLSDVGIIRLNSFFWGDFLNKKNVLHYHPDREDLEVF
jgi:hypothetical protein